jgi:putative ATP-binding cassette transporter
VEKAGLLGRFAGVIGNTWDIVFRSLKFQGFNLVVNQIAVVFPIILQARRYFSGQITLGDVTQTATAFGQVFSALSFFRLAYDDFASYRAVLDRLTGLLDVNDEARDLPSPVTEVVPSGLTVRDLQVRLPDGRPLLTDLDLEVAEGGTLLITGPSGTGKTTLLRSMAGLWPNADGLVERPADADTLFCSQQPYLPLGSLRAALSYPTPAAELSDDDARAVLETVQLAHLGEDLDSERDWSRRLSPGEQQRLSFGRILLRKPSLIFLDESTSAMDEGMEHAMYAHVRDVLPHSTIVSVGHRSSLQRLHADELTLLGEGRWETSSLEDQHR